MQAQAVRSPSAPRQKAGGERARLIKLVHVARRELGLDDPDYRAILQANGGASSSAKMGIKELDAVVQAMKRQGFKVRAAAAPAGGSARTQIQATAPMASDPQSMKARAMWLTLHAIGQVRDPSEAALIAFARRQCKVDRLEWVRDAFPLIESLKSWVLRSMPMVVMPYLVRPVDTWAAHKGDAWHENWTQAVRRLACAKERGLVQLVDEWVDLWKLIELTKGTEGE